MRVITAVETAPSYVLLDTTLALPLVRQPDASLFAEHLKRLLCVEARARGCCAMFISKSHGLPGMEVIEAEARETLGLPPGAVAEHWFLRVPVPEIDGWSLPLDTDRRLPPVGAMTYLVRFHRTTPVLRVDIDRVWWEERIRGATEEETAARERAMFEDIDYTCHDQRCYGYPYPIKAAHDRASLTKAERVALRKQIIDAAVRAGMSRSLFRDASIQTGHA